MGYKSFLTLNTTQSTLDVDVKFYLRIGMMFDKYE